MSGVVNCKFNGGDERREEEDDYGVDDGEKEEVEGALRLDGTIPSTSGELRLGRMICKGICSKVLIPTVMVLNKLCKIWVFFNAIFLVFSVDCKI